MGTRNTCTSRLRNVQILPARTGNAGPHRRGCDRTCKHDRTQNPQVCSSNIIYVSPFLLQISGISVWQKLSVANILRAIAGLARIVHPSCSLTNSARRVHIQGPSPTLRDAPCRLAPHLSPPAIPQDQQPLPIEGSCCCTPTSSPQARPGQLPQSYRRWSDEHVTSLVAVPKPRPRAETASFSLALSVSVRFSTSTKAPELNHRYESPSCPAPMTGRHCGPTTTSHYTGGVIHRWFREGARTPLPALRSVAMTWEESKLHVGEYRRQSFTARRHIPGPDLD